MIKKFVTIIIAFIMLFALVGCEVIFPTDSSNKTSILEEYRANAIQSLQSYVDALDESHFTQANWIRIEGYLEEGKAGIKAAVDKAAVDEALNTAKERIDDVVIEQACDYCSPCLLPLSIRQAFDTTEPKEFWDYTDFDYEHFISENNRFISLNLRRIREGFQYYYHTNGYIKVEFMLNITHFSHPNIERLRHQGWPNAPVWRRDFRILMYDHSLEAIISVVRYLETLCFIQSVRPVGYSDGHGG